MRTLLITGPGGSGRTTTAAATALAAARSGARTLLLGTDRTDTLGPVLGDRDVPGLTVRRTDPDAGFRADLTALQDRAGGALDLLGASRLVPEETSPPPGAEELAVLRALRDAARDEESYDLLVVDLPATPGRSRCSPCPTNCAARCAASCRPNGRPPAPCARCWAGSPASRCPPSGSTRRPPASTCSSPPSRPSSPTTAPPYAWSPNPARRAPTPCAPPLWASPCADCAWTP